MSRQFTINNVEEASQDYNNLNNTNIQLPIIFSTNTIITLKNETLYRVSIGENK